MKASSPASLLGGALAGGATLILFAVAGTLLDREAGGLVLSSGPFAVALGTALGRLATRPGVHVVTMLLAGVLVAFATPLITGAAWDLLRLVFDPTPGPAFAVLSFAAIGTVILSPAIALAGLLAGWLTWRAGRAI